MINIRQKGAEGEREIYNALNPIIQQVLRELGYSAEDVDKAATCVQRNQNQSAVGGNDLVNTFGLSIEVKRQEQLSINTWWKQCADAAARNGEHPVLLYRQNRKKWHCVTLVWLQLPHGGGIQVRAELSWEDFLRWFKDVVRDQIEHGYEFRT